MQCTTNRKRYRNVSLREMQVQQCLSCNSLYILLCTHCTQPHALFFFFFVNIDIIKGLKPKQGKPKVHYNPIHKLISTKDDNYNIKEKRGNTC